MTDDIHRNTVQVASKLATVTGLNSATMAFLRGREKMAEWPGYSHADRNFRCDLTCMSATIFKCSK